MTERDQDTALLTGISLALDAMIEQLRSLDKQYEPVLTAIENAREELNQIRGLQ